MDSLAKSVPFLDGDTRLELGKVAEGAMRVAHVTSSRFFGGPERQMLELAIELSPEIVSSFISFSETGLCEVFLEKVRMAGYSGIALRNDTPHLLAAACELCDQLTQLQATVVCTHGYKSNLIGLYCARKLNLPIISVSHGFTGESMKVRMYEWIDRRVLGKMDMVVAVSDAQASKVLRGPVRKEKTVVIRDAVSAMRYEDASPLVYRHKLEGMFRERPSIIIGAAGRLSPEKGFDVLIDACRHLNEHSDINFGLVLFGDGVLRNALQKKIDTAGIASRFVLAGFTTQLDVFMPHFDLFVQSSHTEGLPNVLLEAGATGVPVVATNVGGTAELVVDGETGILVGSNDALTLSNGILQLMRDEHLRRLMGANARQRVTTHFNFRQHADLYRAVLLGLGN